MYEKILQITQGIQTLQITRDTKAATVIERNKTHIKDK